MSRSIAIKNAKAINTDAPTMLVNVKIIHSFIRWRNKNAPRFCFLHSAN